MIIPPNSRKKRKCESFLKNKNATDFSKIKAGVSQT
jgi:hypothetical protein